MKVLITGANGFIGKNLVSQLQETERNTLIIDAYNANATSMSAALENFKIIDTNKPKCAILGDMLELGTQSHAEHHTNTKSTKTARRYANSSLKSKTKTAKPIIATNGMQPVVC